MARSLDPKKIKSAQRVLEVLEFFSGDRQECTVMDIARQYGYPQSSTSELLSCLVTLGFLRRDRWSRTYKPTARAAMLGAWVQPERFRYGQVAQMMDELACELGATVFLSHRVDVAMQIAHTAPGGVKECDRRPGENLQLLHSAPGKAFLSTHCTSDTKKIVHRINAECEDKDRIKTEEFLNELKTIRSKGYAISHSDEDYAFVSIQLPSELADEPLILTAEMSRKDFDSRLDYVVQTLRGAVARAFGSRERNFENASVVSFMERAI